MEGAFSYFWMILQTLLALGIVCGIAFLIFRVLLPRIGTFTSDGRLIKVLERVSIESGKSLCVVKAADKYFLVGVSEGGMNTLSELNEEEVNKYLRDHTVDSKADSGRFAEKLTEAFGKSQSDK